MSDWILIRRSQFFFDEVDPISLDEIKGELLQHENISWAIDDKFGEGFLFESKFDDSLFCKTYTSENGVIIFHMENKEVIKVCNEIAQKLGYKIIE